MFSNSSRSFILREMRPKRRNSFVTVFILACIVLIFLLAYLAFAEEERPIPSLIQLNVVFRHGERTPSYIYPFDPHKNHTWPDGLGALTNEGKLGMYRLGETFKRKYGHFLGDLFFTTDISIQSSYAPRCQMSIMTFLAGLYPPSGSQRWNDELNWQPILVNPIPREKDNLIAGKAPCNALVKEKLKSDDDLHANLSEEDRDLFEYLSKFSGSLVNYINQVEFLYATLKMEAEHGLTLPDWTKKVYPEPMKRLAAMNLASFTRTDTLKRLQGGPLLKQWLENMKRGNKKAYFYSGHDLTVVTLMRTLGIEKGYFLPDYGATLVLELHDINHEKVVKALYYNSNHNVVPVTLKLPPCETDLCPLKTLSNYLKPYTPIDWANECNSVV